MSTPTPLSREPTLTKEQEAVIRSHAARFEAELRTAHDQLIAIAPSEELELVLRDVRNKLSIATLVTTPNVLPLRLMDLVPVESYANLHETRVERP